MVARAVKPSEVLSLSLAPRAALLMSSDDLINVQAPDRVVKIPGSINRVIATFHVEHGKIDKHG